MALVVFLFSTDQARFIGGPLTQAGLYGHNGPQASSDAQLLAMMETVAVHEEPHCQVHVVPHLQATAQQAGVSAI